jgi:hypothetical protein
LTVRGPSRGTDENASRFPPEPQTNPVEVP